MIIIEIITADGEGRYPSLNNMVILLCLGL